MIIAIRISGLVKMPADTEESLFRLKLRRKYSAVLLHETPENLKIIKNLRNHIAYGKINEETLVKLLTQRAKMIEGKLDVKKVIEGLQKKNLEDLGVKPFFRLHPPRKGIDARKHFGVAKGVLGDNRESINKLVERML